MKSTLRTLSVSECKRVTGGFMFRNENDKKDSEKEIKSEPVNNHTQLNVQTNGDHASATIGHDVQLNDHFTFTTNVTAGTNGSFYGGGTLTYSW